jgi:hypothetical protein
VVRRATVVFIIAALPAAVAGLALGACGEEPGAIATTQPAGATVGPGPGGSAFDLASVVGDALDELVADGTIDAAQRDAVLAALDDGMGGGRPQASPPAAGQSPPAQQQAPERRDMLGAVLDPLVADSTLTTAQAEAISQAVADAMPELPDARAPPSDDSGI